MRRGVRSSRVHQISSLPRPATQRRERRRTRFARVAQDGDLGETRSDAVDPDPDASASHPRPRRPPMAISTYTYDALPATEQEALPDVDQLTHALGGLVDLTQPEDTPAAQ